MSSIGIVAGQLSTLKTIFRWEINMVDFNSKKSGEYILSPEIRAGDLWWRLIFYPEGDKHCINNCISVFLQYQSDKPESVEVNVSFSIHNDKNENLITRYLNNETFKKNDSWGYDIKKENLMDSLLNNNKLKIICEISPSTNFHCEKILGFEKSFNAEKFSDVKFVVDGKYFYAHKIILANASTVFEAMFNHDMKENLENVVKIDDIDYDVLVEMFRFIYMGRVNDIENKAMPLLVAADKYNIVDLKMMCINLLCNSNLAVSNVVDCLATANRHGFYELENQAIDFIVSNARNMTDRPEFDSILGLQTCVVSKIMRGLALK